MLIKRIEPTAMPAVFSSVEYRKAREVRAALAAVPALAPYVCPDVLNWETQQDRLTADAQANSVCIAVSVGEPQTEQNPAPRFTPTAGQVNVQLYVWVLARQEYAVTPDAATAHETCCAVQDAVLARLLPLYCNPADTEKHLPAALTAVDEVNLADTQGLENMSGRMMTFLFPIFYK